MDITTDILNNKILDLIKNVNPDNPTEYVTELVKEFSIEKLNEKISKCIICGFNRQKTLISGNVFSKVLVINDIPKQRQFSINNANQTSYALFNEYENVLFDILTKIGIDPSTLLYCNCVSCMDLHTNLMPIKQEVINCHNNILMQLIEIIKPTAILLLGTTPLRSFCNESFSSLRGTLLDINGIDAMVTYNLSYFESMKGLKEENALSIEYDKFKEDIINFFEYIRKRDI